MRAAGEAHRAVVMSVSVGVRVEQLGGKHTAPLTGRVQKKQLKEGRVEKKRNSILIAPKSKKEERDGRLEKNTHKKVKKKKHEYFPLRRVIHYQGCVRRWWGRAEMLHAEATHSSRSGNPPQSKQKEQRQQSASANSAPITMCPAVTSGTDTRCSCRQFFQTFQLWNRNFVCVEDADLIVIQRAVVQQDIRRGHRHVFFAPCAASIPSNVEVGDSFRIRVFQFT
ncbi:hypothetical protein ECC02_005456 [Trypanosoma cruzi]|uniref:Uncharacterized protein n=1 Tax=Trypanosoma cruzi TaxID=5693 RepID=A0A7J6Y4F8_TRYCR|nr:hypothetical protein ECC02_005456 [Trypanosoma cruzi]